MVQQNYNKLVFNKTSSREQIVAQNFRLSDISFQGKAF